MMGLLANEWIKIFKRKATYILIGITLLLVLGTAIALYFFDKPDTNSENGAWKVTLTEENKNYADDEMMKPYIAENQYRIDHNLPPNATYNVWDFMTDAVSFISFVALFTIIIAAGIIANEFSWGTIKLLLIRPINRVKILLSKYITVLLFALFMISILFVSSFLFGSIFFGFEGTQPYLAYVNGEIVERNIIIQLLIEYGLESVGLLMFTTLAFMISAAFRNSSLAIGLAIFFLLSGNIITGIIGAYYDWAKYLIFANINLSQYINGSSLIDGMTMTFSVIMLAIYFFIFMVIAFVAFVKRDVSA
ncbi:ABC transporter permease [Peribacillus sp. FSL H8-0477]|uniref:ABC transporter permease n=1 Tax=Peribacillus sp. FSL H8-0477 TaxID=2921388 RepID=UPI0030F879BE